MTEVSEFLERPTEVDWSVEPWASAHPGLHWLGLAPPVGEFVGAGLAPDELTDLTRALATRLMGAREARPWSSQWISDAIDAAARAEGGVPEFFVREMMLAASRMDLDAALYEFCREFGRHMLAGYRKKVGWDLGWLAPPRSTGEACFVYWVIGVRPDRFVGMIAESIEKVMRDSGFPY